MVLLVVVLKNFNLSSIAASYSDSYSSDEDDGSPRDKTQVNFIETSARLLLFNSPFATANTIFVDLANHMQCFSAVVTICVLHFQ